MAMIRTKNIVPKPYVSESRDFQLFTRVLDFVQNSVKFDIDNIPNILDTTNMPPQYVDRLKSKLGFFTNNTYDDRALKIALSAFPHIMRYKGSPEGIFRCVYTFLHILGYSDKSKIEIYNTHSEYDHTVRIGILKFDMNTALLTDMLSYVLPTGYLVEIYTYVEDSARVSVGSLSDKSYVFPYVGQDNTYSSIDYTEFNIIRSDDIQSTSEKESNLNTLRTDTYNTANLTTLMSIEEEISDEE